MKLLCVAAVLAAVKSAAALPQAGGSASSASSPPSSGGTLSVPGSASTVATSISTAIPSPTVAVSSPLFSAAAPQQQPWCAGRPGSRIYCPGEILQTVQLAELYADSKTFVDKPTIASEDIVVAAFENVTSANTVEALVNWIDTYFAGEGLDVLPAAIPNFNEDPGFLDYVQDPFIKGWVKQVHGYWRDLVRVNVVNESCSECVSSQIPLNRSFVVPGGRFRENCLLTSGLQDLANNTINNYLDLIDDLGFIPNGGRIYYLNRSQPPLFTQMLYLYIKSTNDTSFLERAVRLNDEELQWWDRNNSVTVTGPSGKSHFTHSYTVNNSAPRPESYAEDWQTVNGPIGGPYVNLSTDLYSDLASGAESGYDYSAGRWFTEPQLNTDDTTAGLRTLDINEIIPVDLESILYRNYRQIAELHKMTGNSSRAQYWSDRADKSREAIIDLHWDSEALAYREYNLTSKALLPRWSIAGYYPYWSGIFPDEVTRSASSAEKAFSGLAYLTAHYNGSIPITLYESGQQWDWPNVWPPTLYITVKALENIPRNVSQVTNFANYSTSAIDFTYLPPKHFGLEQGELPGQPVLGQDVNITSVNSFDTLGNLGNSSGLGWADGLATALVQRYMSSAYCSWYSTGGSIPGLLQQLSQEDLNATNSAGNSGNMFEKFSAYDIDAAGAGGEYQVQAGFGWTNGVAIWFARNYGSAIQAPACPAIELETASADSTMMASAHRNFGLRPNLATN